MNREETTLIMVRRTLAEVNTVLAGVTLVPSFARFSPSMAILSEERTPSSPFGCWELSAMAAQIGARKWCGVVVVRKNLDPIAEISGYL